MLVLAVWAVAACAAAPTSRDGTPRCPVHAVALPAGAVPEVLAADGDQLLVGVRREAAPQPPGLVRRSPDGAVADVPAQAATGYGRTAYWYSLAADGNRILAIGGDRGGAHGNVRWSVWTGSAAGVAEHVQAFSTFGGWGAGDLIDAVLTPVARPSSVHGRARTPGSTWRSGHRRATPGCDGPPPAPRCRAPGQVAFATAATGFGPGVMVAGWQIATGRAQARPRWCGSRGRTRPGGTRPCCRTRGRRARRRPSGARPPPARWPGGGREAGAVAARRRPLEPRPGPPADRGRRLRPARRPARRRRVAHRGRGRPGPGEDRRGGGDTSTRNAAGPTGPVTAAVRVGPSVFVVAGDRLWQADAAALH